jgi:hypothetical protein
LSAGWAVRALLIAPLLLVFLQVVLVLNKCMTS